PHTSRIVSGLTLYITIFSNPSLVEFLPSVGIKSCTLGFKYMFNPFPLPIELVSTSEGVEKIVRWQCRNRLR
ncbi:hypothetical protein A2U01_0066618, partial [Trifolium medium]|nr:hypothetical protein [Trifolium medium]